MSSCRATNAKDKRAFADWFRSWCSRKSISVSDLQSILGVSYGVAQAKLAEGSVTLVDLRRFPTRYRNELSLAFLAWCEESASASALHG